MPRIAIPTSAEAPPASQPTLEAVNKRLGWMPNLFRLMSISPNTLAAFTGIQGSLAKTMDMKTIEAMGMGVSEGSGCQYCLASHGRCSLCKNSGRHTRQSERRRPRNCACSRIFDAEIVAMAGLTAQFLMTNFMNNIAQTELDFPAGESV